MPHTHDRSRSVIACLNAAIAVVVLTAATPVPAGAPPWGACGLNTDPNKIVRTFYVSPRLEYNLRCGGPKCDREPKWGYRHILWRHRGDFESRAVGTYQNWRDIADLAMSSIASDPDVVRRQKNGMICQSRVIFLYNIRTNQRVKSEIFHLIIEGRDIITAFPASNQCRERA